MTGIEYLREIADKYAEASKDHATIDVIPGGVAWLLSDIADQIECEMPAQEDRDAIAWVRDHGGLDQVKMDYDMYEGFSSLVDRVAARLGVSVEGLDAQDAEPIVTSALDRRLMPEGMEWPRFEDGEPVRIGDSAPFGTDGVMEVAGVEINRFGYVLHGSIDDGMRECVDGDDHGVAVKRPAPKVLDADGMKCSVGDSVWWIHNKTGNFRIIRIEPDGKCAIRDDDPDEPCGMTVPSTELTHVRPVLDADGVEIRVGDELWHVSGYGPRTVGKVKSDGSFCFAGCERAYKAEEFTHRAPVLAADGKPLLEGETVWLTDGIGKHVVLSTEKDAIGNIVTEVQAPGAVKVHIHPSRLTHERPVADTWERLEEDCAKSDVDYCAERGLLDPLCDTVEGEGSARHCTDCGRTCGEKMARDLVRRAKALAGGA